ncbi:MAG: endonuclease/exonuclease/phosphatase family protein [Carnobacterium sp.]|uniref:endonuclease/exonuclease/phosphatase family protein n=1 Tax=Carnobacterium sp. TaxID=48221 RepID=UPI003C70D106
MQNMQNYFEKGKDKFHTIIESDNRKLIDYIVSKSPDVIVLSELNKLLFQDRWLLDKNYRIFCSKQKAKFHVLMAVKKNLNGNLMSSIESKDYLNRRVAIHIDDYDMDIIGLHMPSSGERKEFFKEVFKNFKNNMEKHYILCGDINCDTDDDGNGKESSMYNIVRPYQKNDIYTCKYKTDGENTDENKWTWQNLKGKNTRIDRVFISSKLQNETEQTIKYDLYPIEQEFSDHKMVIVNIQKY